MTDTEIERLASEYIAEDWEPDRYYREMNIIAFATKLLEHGYGEGRKDEREQILEDMRIAREKLDAAIARLDEQ